RQRRLGPHGRPLPPARRSAGDPDDARSPGMTGYLIRGAAPLGAEPTDLLLADGVVAATGPDAATQAPTDVRTVEAEGMVALPGLVDLHTHLREPGREDAETVRS